MANKRRRDEDERIQTEALRFIARRVLIWFLPLTLVGILLVSLGIPVWVSVVAMLVALAAVALELDL